MNQWELLGVGILIGCSVGLFIAYGLIVWSEGWE